MQCNIDQRGRKARLVTGAIVDAAGIFAIMAGFVFIGVFLCLAGGFMIFESAKGWCALRAMGFKTRM